MCHLCGAPHATFPPPHPPELEIEAAVLRQSDLDSPGKRGFILTDLIWNSQGIVA